MKYQLTFHPLINRDISDAYNWYEDNLEGLGERFLAELNKFYDKLESHPHLFSKVRGEIRRVKLSHFPFCIIYTISRERVHVHAVFHTSRNPQVLERRIH